MNVLQNAQAQHVSADLGLSPAFTGHCHMHVICTAGCTSGSYLTCCLILQVLLQEYMQLSSWQLGHIATMGIDLFAKMRMLYAEAGSQVTALLHQKQLRVPSS